jgi:hypothetical protein
MRENQDLALSSLSCIFPDSRQVPSFTQISRICADQRVIRGVILWEITLDREYYIDVCIICRSMRQG